MLLLLFDVLLCSQFYLTVMKRTIFLFIGASILLVGCSSTYGSREEATLASYEWRNEGREFDVVYVPTDAEVAEEKQFRKISCDTAREHLRTGGVAGRRLSAFVLRRKEMLFEDDCVLNAPNKVSKETLTTRDTLKTRTCNHERDTRQWTCKEWKVSGDEIMKDKWDEIKPTYSYFRY